MREPRRVCHVLHTLGHGGAQELVAVLAGAAPTAGLELSVLSLTPDAGHDVAIQLRELAVPVRFLPRSWRADPRVLPAATHALRQLDPQIVHSHGKHADLTAAWAARRLRRPQVSTLHLVEMPEGLAQSLVVRAATSARIRSAARTIAVSDAQRSAYLQLTGADPGSVVTIHNGVPALPEVPEQERARIRAELGVSPAAALVVTLGLLRPDRGHADLLAAAELLPPEVTVAVAGDGPLRVSLERQVRAGGARVVFLGFRRDVPALLAAADLVVHPSHTDALPTALIHALAAGRPVVASDVDGIPEVVTPATGILVPPRAPRLVATAVRELLADPERQARMGAAGRERFMSCFTSHAWALRLRALYDEVLTDTPVL